MTLVDLLSTLDTRGALPASRVKDMKTALRYLAAALGQASPEQCTVDTACLEPATWTPLLETHFQTLETQGRTVSAVTRRNTRNNLRLLFRTAEAHGLLTAPLPPRLLTRPDRTAFRRQYHATSPYKTTYPRHSDSRRRYALPQAQWPPEIVEGWLDYQRRCGMRIRAYTFRAYTRWLESYLGYIAHVVLRPPVWEDLFDVTQVAGFVRWHADRRQRSLTRYALNLVIMFTAMARALERPEHPALKAFRRTLKAPKVVHVKRHHWASLATLEAVADACLAEGRAPLPQIKASTQHPGSQRAVRFQLGLILKLMIRVPLRQRNVREMQLGAHLAQDPQSEHWLLEYQGDDLKVSHRGMEINTYQIDLTDHCPEWLALLEEFLRVHRPKLPNAGTSPFVFLTRYGRPYSADSLADEVRYAVAMRTGQRFYPHLVRTVWATEYLNSTPAPDYQTAATMLGDLPRTVMEAYHNVVKKDQHAKAKAFLSKALHAG
jgi:hypothetical protein